MGKAIEFIQNHPEAMYDVLILSAASTCGQLCILYTIREFGALLFATIMTTRQFLSILLSCVIFMHPLTAPQWAGTALVFASLYYQAFLKVGRCSLTLSKLVLKAPMVSALETRISYKYSSRARFQEIVVENGFLRPKSPRNAQNSPK